MEKSNFRDWTLTEVDNVFGLKQADDLRTLTEWLNVRSDVLEYEQHYLSILQKGFKKGINGFNETELANKVISPIFVFAELCTNDYTYFLERPLTATLTNQELTGRVDGMMASGFRDL